MFLVLGIETSCDETSVSIVGYHKSLKNAISATCNLQLATLPKPTILSNKIFSQTDIHKVFGGVVPEVASRNHLEKINFIIEEAKNEAGISLKDLDLITVANRPGLIGGLVVGCAAAKALAFSLDIPIKTVNHIKAHAFSFALEHEIPDNFLSLITSGGHTLLSVVRKEKIEIIGGTRDDAVGECFDKVGRVLGLPYPGGLHIDKISKEGNDEAISFKAPLINEDNFDFSFSGLKTSVINFVNSEKQKGNTLNIPDIAASFQKTAMGVIIEKTIRAAKKYGLKTIAIGGGVAANSYLRENLSTRANDENIELIIPSKILCTDNGAMIAATGYMEYLKNPKIEGLAFEAYSRNDL